MALCQYQICYKKDFFIMDYIQNMVDIRKESGETQKELAQRIGWSRIQIARYETKVNTQTIDYLEAFCIAYKVSADRILGLPKDYK